MSSLCGWEAEGCRPEGQVTPTVQTQARRKPKTPGMLIYWIEG